MWLLRSISVVCPVVDQRHCSEWARKYMGYCLCSKRDGLSLGLGMVSIMSWVVAEIPQIITTYKRKSAQGLSILFLLTWILGDCLNLFGCILEPATLPTQYYTAVLYTVNTLVLSTQAVYYGYIYPRLKNQKGQHEVVEANAEGRKTAHDNGVDAENSKDEAKWEVAPSSPIPLPGISLNNSREVLYFMSARSLSLSHTPPVGSFPPQRTPTSAEQHWSQEPLLSEVNSLEPPSARIKTTLCVASFIIFFIGSCNHQPAESHSTRGIVLQVGRRLLQATSGSAHGTLAAEGGGIGSFLGWGMTAIYLGGRLPQIWLNIKRGNAEGLNPMLFVFALIGNSTYVASILAKSLAWSKVQPNLPWLVDALGCMLLDTFILLQFIYFRYRSRRVAEKHSI